MFLIVSIFKVVKLFFPCVLSENDRPTSLVPDLIDYNMPLTATYLKQMKLQCRTSTERVSPLCRQGQIHCVLTSYLIKTSHQMRSALHCNWISIDSSLIICFSGSSWLQGETLTFNSVLENERSPLISWEEELRWGLGDILQGSDVTHETTPHGWVRPKESEILCHRSAASVSWGCWSCATVRRNWDYLDPDWDLRVSTTEQTSGLSDASASGRRARRRTEGSFAVDLLRLESLARCGLWVLIRWR